MIPSDLLLRYFDDAQRRLQLLSTTDDLVGATSLPLDSLLSRHRMRIVEAQLTALDDSLAEWEHDVVSPNSMRAALQKIGSGDFSCVLFSSTNSNMHASPDTSTAGGLRSRSAKLGTCDKRPLPSTCEIEHKNDDENEMQGLLTRAVKQTNELARQAFARSVLMVEWRNYQSSNNEKTPLPHSNTELRGINDGNVDEGSMLEYCGLMMAGVHLLEVQRFLRSGVTDFLRPTRAELMEGFHSVSVHDRLLHIQRLYWRALGWDPDHAIEQLNRLVSTGCTKCSIMEDTLKNNAKVMQTLQAYTSSMKVAVTNASITNIGSEDYPRGMNDDGTTRVVSVSYSEKIMNLPQDALDSDGRYNNSSSHPSLSAPTRNTINEHESSQQRSELNAAKAMSILQQQIWDEFQLLNPGEQMEKVEAAKTAHDSFVEKVANTPPGVERILLIQQMDSDMQKSLMIHKLWSSQAATNGQAVE